MELWTLTKPIIQKTIIGYQNHQCILARHHAASAVVDGNVYVIGGRVQGVSPITNVNVNEMYDPKMDLWITLNSMPSERSGISATSINNTTIYVFGGENMTKTYNNNEKYNVKDNTWESQRTSAYCSSWIVSSIF